MTTTSAGGAHKMVALSLIHPNPHRNFKLSPMQPARIARLCESMKDTGVWSNIQVRPHPKVKGAFQMAHGHHRVAAAIEVYGKQYEVSLEVLDLGDLAMLQMMAAENAEEFGVSPGHLTQCVDSAVAILSDKMKAIETLALPSRAKSQSGKWHAMKRAGSGPRPIHSSDVAVLQSLYHDEGNYQKARQVGRPGYRVVVEYMKGAFAEEAVKAALGALKASEELGIPLPKITDSVENLSQMNHQVRALKAARGKASPAEARKIVETTTKKMKQRRKDHVRSGRRVIHEEVGRSMQEVGKSMANPLLEQEGRAEEMRAFMAHVPGEIRNASNRLCAMVERAKSLGIRDIVDMRMWGNLHTATLAMLHNLASAMEVFGGGLSAEQRAEATKSAERLLRALRGQPSLKVVGGGEA